MRPVGIVLFVGLNVIYIVNEMISLIQHKQVLPFWESKYLLLSLFPVVVIRIVTLYLNSCYSGKMYTIVSLL